MSGDDITTKDAAPPATPIAEAVAGKRIAAVAGDGKIEHETLPPGESEQAEAKKRELVEKYLRDRAAAAAPPPATAPEKQKKRGSVIALVAVAVLGLLVLVAVAIVLWRLSKSESRLAELREYVLERV